VNISYTNKCRSGKKECRLRVAPPKTRRTVLRQMADMVNRKQRSRMMAAVHGSNTSPEIYVRKKLFAAGFRYRLHAKELVGKPDIVLPRFRTVLFVHGCFWHGHSCPRGKRPASNVEFWNAKIDGNIRRDRRSRVALKRTGWSVVVIWECRMEPATKALLRRLRTLGADCRD